MKKYNNQVLKCEKNAIKEMEKDENAIKKVKNVDIDTHYLMIKHNNQLNISASIYNDKKIAYKSIHNIYRFKMDIARRVMNKAILDSKNASTKSEARIIKKNAKDAFDSLDNILYPELRKASKELNMTERAYKECQVRGLLLRNKLRTKYQANNDEYNTLLKYAISKRVLFEISKKTNMDCASIVLSFI